MFFFVMGAVQIRNDDDDDYSKHNKVYLLLCPHPHSMGIMC